MRGSLLCRDPHPRQTDDEQNLSKGEIDEPEILAEVSALVGNRWGVGQGCAGSGCSTCVEAVAGALALVVGRGMDRTTRPVI